MGLGRGVLDYATRRLSHLGVDTVTCAVDTRNTPAMRVYQELGYERFDSRLGFVAALTRK